MGQGEPDNKIAEVKLTRLEATPVPLLEAGFSIDVVFIQIHPTQIVRSEHILS